LEKVWLSPAKLAPAFGASDCPVVSGAQAGTAANSLLSGIGEGVVAKHHWTVRWCTGLSGEPTVPAPTVGSAISGRRVARANGHQAAPDLAGGLTPIA
jgi:hypothetical protein